jgi:N-methylhydantoinase A
VFCGASCYVFSVCPYTRPGRLERCPDAPLDRCSGLDTVAPTRSNRSKRVADKSTLAWDEESGSRLRLAVDTGGTFTDLVVEEDGNLRLYKSQTTPEDPVRGVLDVIDLAAKDLGLGRQGLLGRTDLFIHATTWATNAILTNTTAKTAFLTTQGHPDILLFREGGHTEPFNFTRAYPEPFVPRSLTYEVSERVGAAGEIVQPLDEASVIGIIHELTDRKVEAVAVCLLWSIANPAHELRIGELLQEHLPGRPYTLSHALDPALREYRRASATAIDASLKPVMTHYLAGLSERLRVSGFSGRVLVVTSPGGVLDATAVAEAPIHAIGSGPAMAPIAGRYYAQSDAGIDTAVVCDAGGTSYDVSLVRRGRIPWTRETWLGPPYLGHMTGFPSVDVKSIGAGGGSIAWIDEGGMLHIGPQSAGAVPGPVCYGHGGRQPTVTDAALILGYLDPDYVLGGAVKLAADAAKRALESQIAKRLRIDINDAAAAVLKLTTEHMVRAIEEITLNQGIDPRSAILVGGGGAAGLNTVAIARRLGSPGAIIPPVAATLSAAGALLSDLSADFAKVFFTTSTEFDLDGANRVLSDLGHRCREFVEGAGRASVESSVEFSVEAHYPHQVWELEIPLRIKRFAVPHDVEELREDFHAMHKDVFASNDPESSIEIVAWRARVRCRLRAGEINVLPEPTPIGRRGLRRLYFPETGMVEAEVWPFSTMEPGVPLEGPAIVESPITTIIIDPGASAERTDAGSLFILPWGRDANAFTARNVDSRVRRG